MPQENLNKIWNAGKYFEPKPEQNPKPTPDETQLSTVKRKINVAKAFIPTQEDPFKQKVEAVLKGIEPASGEAKEKSVSSDTEEIVGTGQDDIGKGLVAGKSIHVKGDVGWSTGRLMSGGEIHVEGNARARTGAHMYGGTLRIDGDVNHFDPSAFTPNNKGTIIWKGETIWEDGKRIEPGWTNLKVEKKTYNM
jgi:hypothetical protein